MTIWIIFLRYILECMEIATGFYLAKALVNHKNSIYSVHYHVFPDNTYIQSYIMTQQKQLWVLSTYCLNISTIQDNCTRNCR